jgi:hypothetical protein
MRILPLTVPSILGGALLGIYPEQPDDRVRV